MARKEFETGQERAKNAVVIQSSYRGYKARRRMKEQQRGQSEDYWDVGAENTYATYVQAGAKGQSYAAYHPTIFFNRNSSVLSFHFPSILSGRVNDLKCNFVVGI